jgi:hypothetical protein
MSVRTRFRLDNAKNRISDATMRRNQDLNPLRRLGRRSGWCIAILNRTMGGLALSLPLVSTGCLSPYAKHSAALAAATAPVIDQAAAAYNSANSIHYMRTDYDAITEFDVSAPVYNPRTVPPLMSDKAIHARLAVLAAFQSYVQSLVAITNGTDSPELQAASKSAGESLTTLGNTLAPSVESTFGIAVATASTTQTTVSTTSNSTTTTATTSSSAPVNPITPAIQNGISTAVDALGQFLINRKVKKELPPVIVAMDPHVKVLCDLLESDITILKDIEDRDYNFVINQQTLFIRESSGKLDPGMRRALITKLPAIARQQQASDQQLTLLSAAIYRLELTHHALAAEAQNNNPESLKQKLADIETAGEELGKFYSSLPTN